MATICHAKAEFYVIEKNKCLSVFFSPFYERFRGTTRYKIYSCVRRWKLASNACVFYNSKVDSYAKKSDNYIVFTVTFFNPSNSCQSLNLI